MNCISVSALRNAGLLDEADRLERAAKNHALWTQRPANESALALSVFGSGGYERLLDAINLEEAA